MATSNEPRDLVTQCTSKLESFRRELTMWAQKLDGANGEGETVYSATVCAVDILRDTGTLIKESIDHIAKYTEENDTLKTRLNNDTKTLEKRRMHLEQRETEVTRAENWKKVLPVVSDVQQLTESTKKTQQTLDGLTLGPGQADNRLDQLLSKVQRIEEQRESTGLSEERMEQLLDQKLNRLIQNSGSAKQTEDAITKKIDERFNRFESKTKPEIDEAQKLVGKNEVLQRQVSAYQGGMEDYAAELRKLRDQNANLEQLNEQLQDQIEYLEGQYNRVAMQLEDCTCNELLDGNEDVQPEVDPLWRDLRGRRGLERSPVRAPTPEQSSSRVIGEPAAKRSRTDGPRRSRSREDDITERSFRHPSPPPPLPLKSRPRAPRKTGPVSSKKSKPRTRPPNIDEKKANIVTDLDEIFDLIDVLDETDNPVPAKDLPDDVKAVLSPYLEKYRSEFGLPVIKANVKNVPRCAAAKYSYTTGAIVNANDKHACEYCRETEDLCIVIVKDKRPVIVPQPENSRDFLDMTDPLYWISSNDSGISQPSSLPTQQH